MSNPRDMAQRAFAASLSIEQASTGFAWCVAVKCPAASAPLRVRSILSVGMADVIEPLEPGEVALWLASVPSPLDIAEPASNAVSIHQARTLLDDGETDRLERFYHLDDRLSFLAAHAGARMLLGGLASLPPTALRFAPSGDGKPVLITNPAALEFNLSHARSAVAVAVARTPVGVDIEPLREVTDIDAISEIVLAAAERNVLGSCPPERRSRLFLRYWTLKEAILKAAGFGFAISPDTIIVDAGPEPAALSLPDQFGPVAQYRLIASPA